jgi:hypothetical protein
VRAPVVSGRAALISTPELNQNRYKYFKWTPKTVRLSLMYVVIVPGIIGYLGYTTDVSWTIALALMRPFNAFGECVGTVLTGYAQGKYDFRNKLRGDTIVEW